MNGSRIPSVTFGGVAGSLLSRLFGRRQPEAPPNKRSPVLRIENPHLGFLNLLGDAGAVFLEADAKALSPLFQHSTTSRDVVPKCNVLLVYCSIDPQGAIAGSPLRLRGLAREAGASIVVVASNNTSYERVLQPRDDWRANAVLVLDRRGERFAGFFARLFRAMFNGQSMLNAWVALAPQIRGQDHPENPSAYVVPEAGHITFGA